MTPACRTVFPYSSTALAIAPHEISGATDRVVDVFTSGGNKVIRYNKTGVSDFRVSENILATGLSGNHRISSVTNPEVDVFTGDILFINNSEPISRDEDQSETVNFIITF